jgi:serine/threonine protein kinase
MSQLVSLLYGRGFHIFKPNVEAGHDEYDLKILVKHHQCFGPFPESFEEIVEQQRLEVLVWVMQNCPRESIKPFTLTSAREIYDEDKNFILKIMELGPRDRPSADELLKDPWVSMVKHYEQQLGVYDYFHWTWGL